MINLRRDSKVRIQSLKLSMVYITNTINSNIMSFFRFVKKRVIYRLGIISLAHAPVHVTDFPVLNVHVDELSSAQIWQHKLCTTLSANVNINYRLPIEAYYRICTHRHIRIEIIHASQNVFWVLTWVGPILVNFIPPPTHVKTQNTFWLPWFIS
jgi:hypothetical protein